MSDIERNKTLTVPTAPSTDVTVIEYTGTPQFVSPGLTVPSAPSTDVTVIEYTGTPQFVTMGLTVPSMPVVSLVGQEEPIVVPLLSDAYKAHTPSAGISFGISAKGASSYKAYSPSISLGKSAPKTVIAAKSYAPYLIAINPLNKIGIVYKEYAPNWERTERKFPVENIETLSYKLYNPSYIYIVRLNTIANYDLDALVQEETTAKYSLRHIVQEENSVLYHLFFDVLADLEAKYGIQVSDILQSKYSILNTPYKDIQALYSLFESVDKTIISKYDLSEHNKAVRNIRAMYDLRGTVSTILTPVFLLRTDDD